MALTYGVRTWVPIANNPDNHVAISNVDLLERTKQGMHVYYSTPAPEKAQVELETELLNPNKILQVATCWR